METLPCRFAYITAGVTAAGTHQGRPVMGVWLLRAAIFGLPTPNRGAPSSRGHDVTVVTGLWRDRVFSGSQPYFPNPNIVLLAFLDLALLS